MTIISKQHDCCEFLHLSIEVSWHAIKLQTLHVHNKTLATWAKYLQVILISLVLLYFGRNLFIPLLFGLLIAFITYPMCKWLENRRWPRSLAITAVMLMISILFSLLILLLGYEV